MFTVASCTSANSFGQQHCFLSKFLLLVFAFLPITSSLQSPFLPQNINASIILESSQSNSNKFSVPSFSSVIATASQSKVPTMSLRAWTCHGRSQKDMVEKLSSAGIIKSTPIKEALSLVDRSNYVENPTGAYMDAPQPIGYGQTISAPHMHSHALEELLPTLTTFSRKFQQSQIPSEEDSCESSSTENELKILDVGCGSGYLTAALGRLVDRGDKGPIHPLTRGRVWGIDVVPHLIDLSTQNILKADKDLIDSGTVSVELGDGWKGLPNEGPFHAIHVGAAAESLPTSLMMQLHTGGVMIIPVGETHDIQTLYKVERLRESTEFRKEDFHTQTLLGVRYVPLVRP